VRTSSSGPPLLSSLHHKHSTGLKVERASWIPKHLQKPATEPPVPQALTPIPPSPKEAETAFALIGSPHRLNSDFAFYTHSKQYPNVTTHFRILFRIFGAHSTSLQLIRTSEAHFRNFGPISDLRSLFRKLRIYFGPPKIISETSHL
jgi:hypothetical protein